MESNLTDEEIYQKAKKRYKTGNGYNITYQLPEDVETI